jgi:hypothetical protein
MNVSRQPYEKIVRLKWPARRKYMNKGPGTAQKVGTNCSPPYAENWGIRLRAAIISVTTEIARKKDTQGFKKNRTAPRKGGNIAGNARKALEAETGAPVVSSENFLNPPQKRFFGTETTDFIETQAKSLASEKKAKQLERVKIKRERGK